jgi:hypothetical protein
VSDEAEVPDTGIEDSNPDAAGPARTAGGMGLSSERRGEDLEGVEGTGSTGTSVTEATGTDEAPMKSLEDPEWKGE